MLKSASYNLATLASNPRASLASWLRYEHIALAAMAQHPRPYVYNPSSMAATTVVSHIRDAVRGAIAFGHCAKKSVEEIKDWWQETTVRHINNAVVIGPVEKGDKLPLEGVNKSDTTLSFPSLSLEEVLAFQLLLSNGRLSGPVIISNPPDLSLLPPRPNVEVLEREDKSVVLL